MSTDQPKKGRKKQKAQDEVKVDAQQPLPQDKKPGKAKKVVEPVVEAKVVEKKPRRPRQPKDPAKVQAEPTVAPQAQTISVDAPVTNLATAIAQVAEVKSTSVEPRVEAVVKPVACNNSCQKPSINYNDLVQVELSDPVTLVKRPSLWDRVVSWFKRQVN